MGRFRPEFVGMKIVTDICTVLNANLKRFGVVSLLFGAKAHFLTRAQLTAHNLAGHSRGEVFHELDFSRSLMRGQPRFHVHLDFLDHLLGR